MKLVAALILLAAIPAKAGNTFDQFIAVNGGKIPQPFSEFLRALGTSSATLIPDGRSRQRHAASVMNPRFVVAPGQPDFGSPPTLFIGYAPAAGQLEVISWNQGKGRFDFLEVLDYDGSPRVVEPSRDRCINCHQAEAPIFPRFPWSETLFSQKVVKAMLEARGGNAEYHGLKFDDPQGKSLVGTNVAVDPAKLDTLVRQANRWLQASQVCRTVCGADDSCKRKILLAGLLSPHYRTHAMRDQVATELQVLLAPSWPREQFAYQSSILPDRDAFGDRNAVLHLIGDRTRLLKYANPEIFPEKLLLNGDLNYEDRLTDFVLDHQRGFAEKRVPYGSAINAANPLLPRPYVSEIERERIGDYIAKNAFGCFGFDSAQSAWLAKQDPKSFESRIADFALTEWPPNPAQILKRLGF